MRLQAENVTELLNEVRSDDAAAADNLMASVYPRLRVIAGSCFSRERAGHTLQATALVHEAYLRIASGAAVAWRNREHFYSVCARQMRRAVIDHGRRHRALRRGCGLKVAFDENRHSPSDNRRNIELLEELLRRLRTTDPVAAEVVELKFFAGMTDEEVAEAIDCSRSNVRRHWTFARAWLRRHGQE